MDKKTIIRMVLTIFLVILLFLGYALGVGDFTRKVSKDAEKFKEEYESFNGKDKMVNMKIPSDNRMVYASKKDVLDLLKSGTGILYFGFPSCPWCRNVVPILVETIKEEGVDTIYYYNAKEDRDEKKRVDGKVVEVKKGSDFYLQVLHILGKNASVYEGLLDENVKRLYFPTIVFVKDGKIVSMHEGTISSQKDPFVSLTKKEEKEIRNILLDGINAVYGKICDDKC